MDPQSPTPKTELNDFPAPIQRRPASWTLPQDIPLYKLYIFSPSPPPDNMVGPVRTAATTVQPPRPPNAWILYRSDKLRSIQSDPSQPRRTQAEVSRLISELWKDEEGPTRAEYERRADARKAEHQRQYPGYRFQPKKKEEKERMRLEAKQKKDAERALKNPRSRQARDAASVASPPLPHPDNRYHPEMRFGAAGPSPPLSAASSPGVPSPYPESLYSSDEQHIRSTNASPYPDSHSNPTDASTSVSNIPTMMFNGIMPVPQASQHALPHLDLSQLSQPGPSQWQSQQHQSTGSSTPSSTPSLWSDSNASQTVQGDSVPSDHVSFEIQSLSMQNMHPWMPCDDTSGFDESMQALLSGTGDPSIFQLSNFDTNLISNPTGEIEVSMGQFPFAFDAQNNFLPQDFANFDFSHLNPDIPGSLPIDPSPGFSSLFPTLDSSSIEYNGSYDADAFINYDDQGPLEPPASRVASSVRSLPVQQTEERPSGMAVSPSTAPYAPPPGAAYSSTRRVAGSWKPSFAIVDSALDHSPPRAWGVPAS